MQFNFELRFTGLIVFSFPDTKPSAGHALVVRSDRHPHRAAFAYSPKDLMEGAPAPKEDLLITDPEGRTFASRKLENEILTIRPTWADTDTAAAGHDPDPGHGLTLRRMPKHVIPKLGSEEPWMELTANLSAVEGRLVQPSVKNRQAGVLDECLDPGISPTSPVAARVDFAHGTLEARNPIKVDWEAADGKPAFQASLASYVALTLQGLSELTVASSQRPDITFKVISGTGDIPVVTVVATISNEPETDFLRNGDYIDHFDQLYRVAQWQAGARPSDPRRPKVKSLDSVTDKICPTAAYALP